MADSRAKATTLRLHFLVVNIESNRELWQDALRLNTNYCRQHKMAIDKVQHMLWAQLLLGQLSARLLSAEQSVAQYNETGMLFKWTIGGGIVAQIGQAVVELRATLQEIVDHRLLAKGPALDVTCPRGAAFWCDQLFNEFSVPRPVFKKELVSFLEDEAAAYRLSGTDLVSDAGEIADQVLREVAYSSYPPDVMDERHMEMLSSREFEQWMGGASFQGRLELYCAQWRKQQPLRELFDSTGGLGWVRRDNWLKSMDNRELHSWYGLKEVYSGDIHAIDLSSNMLRGPLAQSIGSLGSTLHYLDLSNNDITGQIPTSLELCRGLQTLWLSKNQFTGCIPDHIGLLQDLETLYLEENQLGGSLPRSISNCKKLVKLNVSMNLLGGCLPPELGECSSLVHLDANHNKFSGGIPAALGKLQRLQFLSLGENKLEGAIPAELAGCSVLEELRLWSNSLTGEIPAALGALTQLHSLCLQNNQQLNTALPACLRDMKQLTKVEVYGTKILVPEVSPGGFSNKQTEPTKVNLVFAAGSKPASAEQPMFLSALSEHRDTANAQCLAEERAFLGEFRKAAGWITWTTTAGWDQLTGDSAGVTASSFGLGQLHPADGDTALCHGVMVNSEGRLVGIDLAENGLKGGLPSSVGKCVLLRQLLLFGNKLGGAIPHELSQCKSLQVLDLSANRFEGQVPPRLGELSHLEDLWLSKNSLGGSLPAELLQCDNLVALWLNGNDFCEAEIKRFRELLERHFGGRCAVAF
jgi:Leucine-rich repeat (LRR) protein